MPASKQARRDYPMGIPVSPPPGWRPRAAPPPLPRRSLAPRTAGGLLLRIGLVGLMVLVCMGIGWLSVQGRQKDRVAKVAPSKSEVVKETPVATPKPKEAKKVDEVVKKIDVPKKKVEPEPVKPVVSGPALTYAKHVKAILENSCVSCHNKTKTRGKLDLSTYATMMRGGENGLAVKAGKPDDSPLYTSIVSMTMPPSGKKLPPNEMKILREWIASGAK